MNALAANHRPHGAGNTHVSKSAKQSIIAGGNLSSKNSVGK